MCNTSPVLLVESRISTGPYIALAASYDFFLFLAHEHFQFDRNPRWTPSFYGCWFFLIMVSLVELTLFICFNIEQIRKGTNYSRENRLCKIFIDFYSILYPFSFWALYCLSFQFTDSEDPIGILKLFFNEDGLCLIHVICVVCV